MNFWVIEDASDASFCRIASTLKQANEIKDWFTNSTEYTGTYSHTEVTITDANMQKLYCFAADVCKGDGGPWT